MKTETATVIENGETVTLQQKELDILATYAALMKAKRLRKLILGRSGALRIKPEDLDFLESEFFNAPIPAIEELEIEIVQLESGYQREKEQKLQAKEDGKKTKALKREEGMPKSSGKLDYSQGIFVAKPKAGKDEAPEVVVLDQRIDLTLISLDSFAGNYGGNAFTYTAFVGQDVLVHGTSGETTAFGKILKAAWETSMQDFKAGTGAQKDLFLKTIIIETAPYGFTDQNTGESKSGYTVRLIDVRDTDAELLEFIKPRIIRWRSDRAQARKFQGIMVAQKDADDNNAACLATCLGNRARDRAAGVPPLTFHVIPKKKK
jgi:hypothetical protein